MADLSDIQFALFGVKGLQNSALIRDLNKHIRALLA